MRSRLRCSFLKRFSLGGSRSLFFFLIVTKERSVEPDYRINWLAFFVGVATTFSYIGRFAVSYRSTVCEQRGQASVSPFSLRRAKSSKIMSSSPSASLKQRQQVRLTPRITRGKIGGGLKSFARWSNKYKIHWRTRTNERRTISSKLFSPDENSTKAACVLKYWPRTCPTEWGSCRAVFHRCPLSASDWAARWVAPVPLLPVSGASGWTAAQRPILCVGRKFNFKPRRFCASYSVRRNKNLINPFEISLEIHVR